MCQALSTHVIARHRQLCEVVRMPALQTRPAVWLDALADHVLAHGLAGSSLRAMARAAGTSDRMLLYYYADKDALIAAILDHTAARMMMFLAAAAPAEPLSYEALRARVAPTLRDPAVAPFMRLWLELAAAGAAGDDRARSVGAAIGRGFMDWIVANLAGHDRAAAARLLAELEGMALLDALGLGDVVDQALDHDSRREMT